MHSISVVSPFFNEEEIIAGSVKRLAAVLQKNFQSWELILINDGSTDNSLEILLEAIKGIADDRISVLSYEPNYGRGYALKTGIAAAQNDIIVTTEADLSWGDDIISRLVEPFDTHQEIGLVVASPHMAGGGFTNVPWGRIFLSTFGNFLIGFFVNLGVSMHTGMTRAYRREVIQPLNTKEREKEFHLEVLFKLFTLGTGIYEIPATINWAPQRAEKSEVPLRKSSTRLLRTIGAHLGFIAIAHPMRFFGFSTALSGLIGLAFLASATWYLAIGETAIFMALTGLLMMMFCLLLFGFSILFNVFSVARQSG